MPMADAGRWLEYARSDLAAAGMLAADPDHYPRQVCYLAQQSIEKALKAALIRQRIEFPFSHDLDRLRNLLPNSWQVKAAFPDLAEMTIWAIEARYPADMPEVLPADAVRAIAVAKALLAVIEEDMQALSTSEDEV